MYETPPWMPRGDSRWAPRSGSIPWVWRRWVHGGAGVEEVLRRWGRGPVWRPPPSVERDPVRPLRQLAVNPIGVLRGHHARVQEFGGLPWHRGGAEDRAGPSRVVDVV